MANSFGHVGNLLRVETLWKYGAVTLLPLLLSLGLPYPETAHAQPRPRSPVIAPPLPDAIPRPNETDLPTPNLPSDPDTLLPVNPTPVEVPPQAAPLQSDQAVYVREIQVLGVTVFDQEDIAAITEPYSDRFITFTELLEVRTQIVELYLDAGYVTSGAFVPPQTLQNDVVIIEAIEGTLADVEVEGLNRLNPNYVRNRLRGSADDPLNVDRLLDRLRLLRLDSRIDTLSAELSAGTEVGSSILNVEVVEANTVALDVFFDNASSPSVGEFRRGFVLREDNLFGQGDEYLLAFSNTEGSNLIETSYSYPVNALGGRVSLTYSRAWSRVVEEPFDFLNIYGPSDRLELTFSHPIFRTPNHEFGLSLTGSYRESEVTFNPGGFGESPFPRASADFDGISRLGVIRFGQDYLYRGPRMVVGAGSEFNFGLGRVFDDNETFDEDFSGEFFSWTGQAQMARVIASDVFWIVRGEVQLTDDVLPPSEQFRLGGLFSVRGYREDARVTDAGWLLSSEVRIPVFNEPDGAGVVQLIPFVDVGSGWNAGEFDALEPRTLAAAGVGVSWSYRDRLNVAFNWGIPLIDLDEFDDTGTLQDSGLTFQVSTTFF